MYIKVTTSGGSSADVGSGLFQSVSGTVKNLEIRNSVLEVPVSRWFIGFFSGRTLGATFENCISSNNQIILTTGSVAYVGGIVGNFQVGE